MVTRDEEGYLYFQGRRDAMIKTSGFRVSPTEVEETAARFPGVDACVAVGVPNVEIGEDVALVYTVSAPVDAGSSGASSSTTCRPTWCRTAWCRARPCRPPATRARSTGNGYGTRC